MMIEHEEHNIGFIKDTYVCVRHINDYAIKNFIRNCSNKGRCSYCKKTGKIVSLENLIELIVYGVNFIYEDAANWMSFESKEGGYFGRIYSNDEIVEELLEIDDYELEQDIINGIADIPWSTQNDYYSSEGELLEDNWSLFKEVVKYKNRYLFTQSSKFKTDEDESAPFDIFFSIGNAIISLGLLSKIKTNSKLYRVRQHDFKDKVKHFVDIASAPQKNAIYSNRMSPAGISMFYCSFDKLTSIRETVIPSLKKEVYVSVGTFKNKRELNVIDLSLIKHISIFDKEKQHFYYLNEFLKSFVNDLSKDVKKDGKEHIEYVPTQVVTEFFRYPFSEEKSIQVDGIIYPSSKSKGEKACVLFFDSDECIEELILTKLETKKND